MMTYLKHVGNFKHSDLKTKKFEEIQALYEKIKRSDEDFISIRSAKDERLIKEMNEKGIDSSKNESVKEEDKEEEGTKKRKGGHIKMIARKKVRKQSDVDSDDEHKKCLKIVTFENSDYAGANLDRKSTTGGCQFLGRRLISWQCKKQTIVATSTTEAEYVVAASCCGQVLWIQNQMLDYGFNFMNTKIYIDNESTICIVKNPVYHSKTKHIAIRHHFIRDAYEKKLIQVLKIHTNDNVADLLTKAFDVSRFQFLVVTIGMINP
ncbi:hypothetical protein Tco_0834200 [Tanacetum coccineum]